MNINRSMTCNKSQEQWLRHHLQRIDTVYEELWQTLTKRFIQLTQEKAYKKAAASEKVRYLERRRLPRIFRA